MWVERAENFGVNSLVDVCLKSFKKFLSKSLKNKKYMQKQLHSVEKYIKKTIPTSLYKYVKIMLEIKRPKFDDYDECIFGEFYIYNRIRLAELFGEEEVDIVYTYKNAKTMDSLDLSKFKKCVTHMAVCQGRSCAEQITHKVALHYMANNVCTMTSVVSLELTLCNTELFKIVTKSCPCLEEFVVVSLNSSMTDLIWFCGFDPSKVTKYIQVKGLSHQSKSVCKNLKLAKIPLRLWEHSEAIAIMLTTFTKLEYLDLFLNTYCLTIAFQLIYGFNETRYSDIESFLNLKTFECSLVLSPTELSLVVKACPLLHTVLLTCSSSTRCDQNLLAELLPLTNLRDLSLNKADMNAFRWFLTQKGKSITHLFYAYDLRDGTTRSLVEFIARACPALEELSLDGDTRISRLEDDFEGSDGPSSYSALPLKILKIKSVFNDVAFLVSYLLWLFSPAQLERVTMSTVYPFWISYDDCVRLFTSPFFSRAKEFCHGGFIRGMNEGLKLLEAAPLLEDPLIICHDGEYEFFEGLTPIRVKNYLVRSF